MAIGQVICQSSSTITCCEVRCHSPAPGADGTYSKLMVRFDDEPGEKEFYKGFVYDVRRVSNRVEKLAQLQTAKAYCAG